MLIARVAPAPRRQGLAIAGAVAFGFQTLVLDAIVWLRYFPR